ncbi:MAG: hypothetical protein HYW78_02155 [Parcubacteria group bacterium]|nr:hypothetical protein [Parcubacteria group bacterium]
MNPTEVLKLTTEIGFYLLCPLITVIVIVYNAKKLNALFEMDGYLWNAFLMSTLYIATYVVFLIVWLAGLMIQLIIGVFLEKYAIQYAQLFNQYGVYSIIFFGNVMPSLYTLYEINKMIPNRQTIRVAQKETT